MSRSFNNGFSEFSMKNTDNLKVINSHLYGLNENMIDKLQKFSNEKMAFIKTNLEAEVFDRGDVYVGSAGFAFFYVMKYFSSQEQDPMLLKEALKYIKLKDLKGKTISFICGDAGPLALATVISYKLSNNLPDNLPDYKRLAQKLMDLIKLSDKSPDELLYGKVGYLYSLLFVNKYTNEQTIPSSHIQKVISAILESGKEQSRQLRFESPLIFSWHDKIYFGGAHGVAGILYVLLQGRQYVMDEDMKSLIKPTLDWLLKQRFPSNNYPSSYKSSSGDKLVQWCHGAPGFVALTLLAYEIFGDEKYLDIAKSCGDVVWKNGLCKKGFSICHGVAGNAYSFLELYQCTKEPIHLYRACCFLNWCLDGKNEHQQHVPDRPASLFEGLLGRIYLATDILNIMNAKFPAYTV